MKTNQFMMASLLTVTAGVAAQVVAPSQAQAAKKQTEAFKKALFQFNFPARTKDAHGNYIMGHLYLDVIQGSSYVPNFPNLLKAEMEGNFYFEADVATEPIANGQKAKYTQYLAGADDRALFDLIDSTKDTGHTYQVYDCSSTNNCSDSGFTVNFNKGQVSMSFETPEYSDIEVLVTSELAGGQTKTEWSKSAYEMKATRIK